MIHIARRARRLQAIGAIKAMPRAHSDDLQGKSRRSANMDSTEQIDINAWKPAFLAQR